MGYNLGVDSEKDKNMKTSSSVAKAKYVVESSCSNGNVFLHGPFGSRAKAEDYVESCDLEESANSLMTHKIRAILHPTKLTKTG